MSQNYYSSEDNAQTWLWTALVIVIAAHDLFHFTHFLCSINYFEFNMFIHIYVQEKNYILCDEP